MTAFTASRMTGWLSTADCSIDDFAALVDQQTHLSDYPYADAVQRNVLIYGDKLRAAIGATSGRRAVQTELMRALTDGPGIMVFKEAFDGWQLVAPHAKYDKQCRALAHSLEDLLREQGEAANRTAGAIDEFKTLAVE